MNIPKTETLATFEILPPVKIIVIIPITIAIITAIQGVLLVL
jgi:hypothetical protein